MSANDYRPKPLDTKEVRLPREIEELTEQLSRNAHEVWAKQRMSEGWKWGPQRDDAHKLHPSLVPYEQLPEPEKEYDRGTAMETVRAILALGFRIERE
jgi:hypothetical protein